MTRPRAEEGRFLILFDESPVAPPTEQKSAAAGKEANPAKPIEAASETASEATPAPRVGEHQRDPPDDRRGARIG